MSNESHLPASDPPNDPAEDGSLPATPNSLTVQRLREEMTQCEVAARYGRPRPLPFSPDLIRWDNAGEIDRQVGRLAAVVQDIAGRSLDAAVIHEWVIPRLDRILHEPGSELEG